MREAKADVFLAVHLADRLLKTEAIKLLVRVEIMGGQKVNRLVEAGECLAPDQAEETQQVVLAV